MNAFVDSYEFTTLPDGLDAKQLVSKINYAIFVSVFDMIVILWGIGACFKEGLAIGIVPPILDVIATLLTVIAGIVLAAGLGVHSCGNRSYLVSNALTNGSNNPSKRC